MYTNDYKGGKIMTHFLTHTNVIIPKDALDTIRKEDIYAQITEMFAPYDEQPDNPEYLETVEDKYFGNYQYNPNAKWDWYVIGGRFNGRFDNKKGINSYMDGNLASAEDMYAYAAKSLEQAEDIASDFLDEYKKIAFTYETIPPVPNYKDVQDGNMTKEEFKKQNDQLQESVFFEEVINLIRDTNEKVENVSGIDPGYLEMFSTTPMDIIQSITLESDEKDFHTCVNLLEWFTPVSYVDYDDWYERGSVGWLGHVGQDEREEKKWVYKYVELLEQAVQKSTDDEQSCIVIIDVHI